ncbi:MAG: hypothetical protein KDN19_13325 [Verrucomicrobiae bacterium]|nr:hypothetical protein [Verrucomicrobiae bacterium]
MWCDSSEEDAAVSVKGWLVLLVLTSIPIVGLGFLVYWAFFSVGNYNLRNFSRAVLLLSVVAFVGAILWAMISS